MPAQPEFSEESRAERAAMNHSTKRKRPGLWLALALITAVSAVNADQRMVYKSVLPDGTVVYGDAPVRGAAASQSLYVEPHPDDPDAAARSQAALARLQRSSAESFARREARVRELDAMVIRAEADAASARQRRVEGAQIQEGDRQGRRLNAAYGQRQAELAAEEARTSARLAALRTELGSLRP
jgi:hypothetical protein